MRPAFLAQLNAPGWRGDLLALAAGALAVTAFAPFEWRALAPLAFIALIHLCRPLAPRQAARRGFAFGAGLFAFGTAWIWNSLHDIGHVPAPLALLLLGVMVAIMALWTGLAAWLATRLAPPGWRRAALAWPAAWVLVEWARGWVLSGFPWLVFGYSQVAGVFAPLAPVAGVLGVSLVLGLVAGGVYAALRAAPAARVQSLGVLAASLGVAVAVPLALGPRQWTAPEGAPLDVALVQGNVAQSLKWDPAQVVPTLALYAGLTQDIEGVDLVIWPEAAIPLLWNDYPEGFLEDLTGPGRPALMMGALWWEAEGDRYYNAVATVGEPVQLYRKQHLVPFGEYFPVPDLVRTWLKLMNLPYSDFAAGEAGQAPLLMAGARIGASICYEAAFADAMMAPLPAANLLVNVSNDAWFGDSIGPHQHFQMARMRALEAGRPLLRATNTGITAAVDERGGVMARLPQFESGVLRVRVQPLAGSTPYVRFRDWPVLALCALLLLAARGFRIRHQTE